MSGQKSELVKELICRVAGEIGFAIYSLNLKNEFTDEQLSHELEVEINEVRKALFSLYELGLAEYRRKRDDETGWMEYHWKLNYDRVDNILKRELKKTLRNLESKIEIETDAVYYICENGCVKVSYDVAMENNFICPQCGGMLEYIDNSSTVKKAKEEAEKIKEYLKLIPNENEQ